MKKLISVTLDLLSIIITFTIFFALCGIFSKIGNAGQIVANLAWIPFTLLTVYMTREFFRERKLKTINASN